MKSEDGDSSTLAATVHFKCPEIIPDQRNQKFWRWDLLTGIVLPLTQVIVHPRPTLVKKELFSFSVTFTQYCWVNCWIYLLINSRQSRPHTEFHAPFNCTAYALAPPAGRLPKNSELDRVLAYLSSTSRVSRLQCMQF